ncbi:MAG: UDP-N-acetyl-D-mannosamine dehydrogenase [Methanomassiliicoccales archaeon PtaU1.Bin124]|nr:MAG: UDP-N-acetyl-D-mannosamine dehydrogenase [Methanomassiliicoccales archaeon PtaU1.Bin124]
MSKEKVAVVGLGYVGLPLACLLADSGFQTIGVDVDRNKLEKLRQGISPIEGNEPGLAELVDKVADDGSLTPTDKMSDVVSCDAIFICVDTPLNAANRPDLTILINVTRELSKFVRKGMMLSFESTLPPGTCRDRLVPLLEQGSGLKAGTDFSVVHCPERVMPGKLLGNMRSVERVLGGIDAQSIKKGAYFYSKVVRAELHPTDLLSAEICKTTENAYRDVQIAFANEVALLCEQVGGDAYEVRRLVNTCPYRDMHIPGSGVGGHCLPKDSWLLMSSAPFAEPRVMPAAREINERMPIHLADIAVQLIKRCKVPDPKVAVMGLSFLRDSDDTRHSPAIPVIDALMKEAKVVVHDSFAREAHNAPLVRSMEEALKGADCVVFVTDHSEYAKLDLAKVKELMRTPNLVDGRNVFNAADCRRRGFTYAGIGKG